MAETHSTHPVSLPAKPPLPWQRRPSFSLLTLLLCSALLVTVISHTWTSRQLDQLRKESYGLEVGLLNRFYVRKLPPNAYGHWQWKAYIPPDKMYRINLATEEISRRNLPNPRSFSRITFKGEVVINVWRHPSGATGSDRRVTIRITQGSTTDECITEPLTPSDAGMAFERAAGADQTDSFSADQAVVLLRGHSSGYYGMPSRMKTRPAGEGILVWIDEMPRLKTDL